MFGLVKIAGLSAVLSASLVTAYAPTPPSDGKLFHDRIAATPEDGGATVHPLAFRLGAADTTGSIEKASNRCASQAWPNIAPECLSAGGGAQARAVRTITIEKRDEANTSTLVRLPVDGSRR
jgi:hypothetical protein